MKQKTKKQVKSLIEATQKTKKEIKLLIEELETIEEYFDSKYGDNLTPVYDCCVNRIKQLTKELETAPEDMFDAVTESHRILCEEKNMGLREAFGHDPSVLYTLALSEEVGELAGILIKKTIRNGSVSFEEKRAAIMTELDDILIYAILLAQTHDINPHELVNAKTAIIIERARSGYYGSKLNKDK